MVFSKTKNKVGSDLSMRNPKAPNTMHTDDNMEAYYTYTLKHIVGYKHLHTHK